MLNGQIIRYSNVDQIENFTIQTMYNLKTDKYHHKIQNNPSNGLFDSSKELENSTVSEDILIPINFRSSKQHNILKPLGPSAISLPLFLTQSLIPLPNLELDTQQFSKVLSIQEQLIQEQAKSQNILLPLIVSYPFIEDTNTLLFILTSANNPKHYEPKSYKQATLQECGHHKNSQKAM